MSNGKSERKKLAKTLATIIAVIVLVIAPFLGIDLTTSILENETTPTQQEATIPNQSVEGELVVHMIDVGQAD